MTKKYIVLDIIYHLNIYIYIYGLNDTLNYKKLFIHYLLKKNIY